MKRTAVLVSLLFTSFLLAACSSTSQPVFPDRNLHRASQLNAELGAAYIQRGKKEWALQKLKKALEENPDNAEAHHYIAVLYQQLGENSKAESHFKRALELMPNNRDLLNNYGVFLCSEKRFDQAEKYFTRVLDNPLNRSPAETYENMGICAQRADKLPKAEAYLRRALRLDPQRPKTLFSLAQISYVNKHYLQARAFYQRYLDIAKQQNPRSLLLGIKIENQLGNGDAVASYALLLKGKYPDSDETSELNSMEAKGTIQ